MLVTARAAALGAALILSAGCASVRPGGGDTAVPAPEPDCAPLDPTAAKTLFPLNVAPDIASNTILYVTLPFWIWTQEDPGNLWPFVWLTSPIFGVVGGVADAWHGWPFWDPVALDEHRGY